MDAHLEVLMERYELAMVRISEMVTEQYGEEAWDLYFQTVAGFIKKIAKAVGKEVTTYNIEKFEDVEIGEMKVERISLKKSTLTPSGPIYEDIRVFEL